MVPETTRFILFVYGTMLEGEADHATLGDAPCLGPANTAAGYALVEFRAMAGLVERGISRVYGQLYSVSYETLRACDKLRDHPNRYHRKELVLEGGTRAHCYLLHTEQARGLRRIRHGDWLARFRRSR